MVIDLGNSANYSQVIGKRLEFAHANAELHEKKNTLEVTFTAQDSKALLMSMGSVIRQLTIVGSVVAMADSIEAKQALNSKRAKTQR